MRYGFVKVCAVSPEIKVADAAFNAKNIIDAIVASNKAGSMLTVFPELSVCGYTCGDLFNQSALLSGVEAAVSDVVKSTEGIKTLVFIGAPVKVGDALYNCAVAIFNGKILGVVPKTCIPNYGEFYELRHFKSGKRQVEEIDYCGQKVSFGTSLIFKASNMPEFCVAAEICEDLWAPLSPSVYHARAGAKIIVNLSCSNETVGKAEYRESLVKIQSAKLVSGYVYCDAGLGESTTDAVFAAHDIICENGKIISESKPFEGGLAYGEIDVEMLTFERMRTASSFFANESEQDEELYTVKYFEAQGGNADIERHFERLVFVPSDDGKLKERSELILSMQAKGLEKRLAHTGCKHAVLGVSGGLDSTLALLVIKRAFENACIPAKNIIAVTMPGFGTSARTKGNSLKLIELTGATCKEIPITESVRVHFNDIGHDEGDKNVTYENAQARMRTLVLMDVANDLNGLVVGTGDLSELALGWATYNGDHMSMYGVNASVPKTLVKHLVKFEAARLGGEIEKVLGDVLATEISPELLPTDKDGKLTQKTEDLVGPYELHDFFLYYFARYGFSPEKIKYIACKAFEGAYDEATVEKWLKVFLKRFFSQQFKRSCLPDGVKIGSVALSPRGDWRMPSDACVGLWLKDNK